MQTSQGRPGMFSLQCREKEEASHLHTQGLTFSTSFHDNWFPFMHMLSLSTLFFALYRMSHLTHAYAPFDPTRPSASTIPIRLAQLKSAALEPEVEIQGAAGTLRGAWTQTAMARYDQPVNINSNSIITCKGFLGVCLKRETFLIAKHDFGIIW